MYARRTNATVIYSSGDSKMIAGLTTSVSYTDPGSGESDTISIEVVGDELLGDGMPKEGDTIEATIELQNWGMGNNLFCGSFVLDDFSVSGWPVTGNISGVSAPVDKSFKDTKHYKNWENVSIKEIASEIAGKAELELVFDADCDFTITALEQENTADSAFLKSLCEDYGLCMKVYSKKIVIFDREIYKKKSSVMTVTPSMTTSMSWKTKLQKTYTGGYYHYNDPITQEEYVSKVGESGRMLIENGKADSAADAERKMKAKVNNANHGHTTMNIEMMGNGSIFGGQCVDIVGFGKADGKYYVDKVSHSVGSGYKMSLELSKVEEGL